MELQEFAPRHLIAQMSFAKTQPAVVDHRGTFADKLAPILKATSVSMDELGAEVATDESMAKFRIGIRQLLATVIVRDFDAELETVSALFREGLHLSGASDLSKVVAHTSDVAAVSSFKDLRDALAKQLPSPGVLREAVGIPVDDLGWALDFKDENWLIEVKIGPMEDDQLRASFQAPKSLDLPTESLFLDVKAEMRRPKKDSDGLLLWKNALDRNRKITQNVGSWLQEVLN